MDYGCRIQEVFRAMKRYGFEGKALTMLHDMTRELIPNFSFFLHSFVWCRSRKRAL